MESISSWVATVDPRGGQRLKLGAEGEVSVGIRRAEESLVGEEIQPLLTPDPAYQLCGLPKI